MSRVSLQEAMAFLKEIDVWHEFKFSDDQIMRVALTPNNVIFSFSAIFKRRSSLLNIGKPSNNTIDAFEAKTEINQFHIIHPHDVK